MSLAQALLLEDVCDIPVKFSEIDAMNRVWHGSYVRYLEDGRESFGRHYKGIGYADMVAAGILAPIVDLHMKYYDLLGLNDIAEVHTRYVAKIGARLDFTYEVRRKRDNALCVTATTTQLFIDPQGKLLLQEPDYYVNWKKQYGIS